VNYNTIYMYIYYERTMFTCSKYSTVLVDLLEYYPTKISSLAIPCINSHASQLVSIESMTGK